jgi:hypothetical protein
MSHLLQAAIAAHGGLNRWNSYRKISLDLSVVGALWDFKGQTGLFRDAHYEAELNAQRAILGRFGGPDQRVRFSPNRLVLETASGEPIESRDNPRGAFKGHQNDTPWDRFHAAYFDGYALWTYLTQPFLYSYPGFETFEIEPWDEDGETWRRLKSDLSRRHRKSHPRASQLFRPRRIASASPLRRGRARRRDGRPIHPRLSRARRHIDAASASRLSARPRQSKNLRTPPCLDRYQ